MSSKMQHESGPEQPKLFDRWVVAVIAAVIAFLIYGGLDMAGLV